MAVISIVKYHSLEKTSRRIDAEYYQPEYLKLYTKLLSFPHKKIRNFAFVTDGIHEAIIFDESSPINLISAKAPKENYFKMSDIGKISEEQDQKNPRTRLRKDDVIVSTVGTIGNCAVVDESILPANADRHVGIIRIKNSFYPRFLSCFLLTKYGRFQTLRESTGNVQLNLFIYKISEIVIPQLDNKFQERIERICANATFFLNKAKQLCSQAENLLLEQLGLKDFKPKYELSYIANLSGAFSVHRIDAEYFQPAYESVVKKIKKYPNGFAKLLKYVENVKPNFDPTKYPEQTFSYVELADIDSSIGVIHSTNELKGEEAPNRARRMLKEKDVIVSSVEGSLEKVALIDKENEGCLASTGFFQFRPLNILPEALLVLSKTIILLSQFKKQCSGTILTAVPKESLRDIVIPILPIETQQKIASLVQQSHEARRKAKELLEIAKKSVEIAIDKMKGKKK